MSARAAGRMEVGRGGRVKEKPLLFAFAIATTSVRGLPLRGVRVWICIVTRLFFVVPGTRIELVQPYGLGILSPLRLPVPPSGHELYRILVSG